jgi:tripeptide aminopeptidase
MKLSYTVTERFLRYVQVDTQADPHSGTSPSSENQKDLSRMLAEELREMGIADVELTEHGYVYATIPANTDKPHVPVVCYCAHVDTAPDAPGANVRPLVHRNWQGQDIVLPDDPSQVIRLADFPHLHGMLGQDIITASGRTLLGADDKAGVAEIMDAAYQLANGAGVKHGKIRLLFTTDEEIGRGVDHVDISKLGADFGYTLDGGPRGHVEDETFSADGAKVTICGVAAHPGYAKGKMENAVKIAADILAALPKDSLCPEATSGKQGFIHPGRIEGVLEEASITFILRDFTEPLLREKEALLRETVASVLRHYPNSTAQVKVWPQYRNLKEVLDLHPQVMANAEEAIRRAGMTPVRGSIRGGTDGSRLSFMGLPCPNLFAGEYGIHSRREHVSVQDMEKAVEMLVQLAAVWEEQA